MSDNLNIKNVKKTKNLLLFPVYCLGVYQKYLIIGGGGGNEIANKLSVYDLSDTTQVRSNELKEPKGHHQTGKDVANHIEVANQVNVLAVCMGESVVILKIVPETGELQELHKFKADFSD
mmetsp:Transcript_33437/g.51334  ORF Transcript_33437/g.51334 Transcript_33437/m.51334 type:complete len:120 (+) Transcript_33437:6-365(+)